MECRELHANSIACRLAIGAIHIRVIGTHYGRAIGAPDFMRNDNGIQIHFATTATDCRERTWEQRIIAALDSMQLIIMPLLCSSVPFQISLAPLRPEGCHQPKAQVLRGNCLCTTMLHDSCIDCVGVMSLLSTVDMQPLVLYSN